MTFANLKNSLVPRYEVRTSLSPEIKLHHIEPVSASSLRSTLKLLGLFPCSRSLWKTMRASDGASSELTTLCDCPEHV